MSGKSIAKIEKLTLPEQVRLLKCEEKIERGGRAFLEMGRALREVQESQLYKGSHGTFEAYCRERWDLGLSRCHQLMDAVVTIDALSTIVEVLPANEGQARALAAVSEPRARAEVWQAAVAGRGQRSAAVLRRWP